MKQTINESSLQTKDIALNTLRNLFNEITLTNRSEQILTHKVINSILQKALKQKHLMLHLTSVRSYDNYTFEHSMNVCMLSLLIGLHLNLSNQDLYNLGLSALLHDIGMGRVDKEILYKQGTVTPKEKKIIEKHPVYGYEILKDNPKIPEEVAIVAWQHHERLDGSGYPRSLRGDNIHKFAKIVAVADVFDALLAERPFRKAFYPHQAVEIIVNSVEQFDPEIIKVLLKNIAIYPIGTRVELNNGETGIVVDMNKGCHTRPIVRLVKSNEGKPFNIYKEIDLSKYRELYIIRVIKGK